MEVDSRTHVIQLILFYLEVYTLQYINKDVQTCITKDKKTKQRSSQRENYSSTMTPSLSHTITFTSSTHTHTETHIMQQSIAPKDLNVSILFTLIVVAFRKEVQE